MIIGKYRLFRTIGDGSFSTVKLGYHIFTQEPVAVKIINKYTVSSEKDTKWLEVEVEVMRMLDHPGIVKMIDFLEDESAYFIIMEYCGGGELFDFIISRSRVEEPLAKRLFKQMTLAVGHCHSKNIVHRDLKPENLLLTETNVVKLIDFGLCSTHADQPLTNRCGSACYIAPEALTQPEYYGPQADIWALGVILYALVDGSLPWNYDDPDLMYQQITTGSFAPPKALSDDCMDLLRKILNPDPTSRITIDGIINHPWLNGIGNVFPTPKVRQEAPQEPRLSLSMGGFSSQNLHQMNALESAPPPVPLETIYEDGAQPTILQTQLRPEPSPRRQTVQPRSISLNVGAMEESEDDGTNTHRGVILSQTVSHRDPQGVALRFENALRAMGASYRRTAPLEFVLHSVDLQVSAEVCRLYGFRNVYVISFKRLHGDSWTYTQYVTSVLNQFKSM